MLGAGACKQGDRERSLGRWGGRGVVVDLGTGFTRFKEALRTSLTLSDVTTSHSTVRVPPSYCSLGCFSYQPGRSGFDESHNDQV